MLVASGRTVSSIAAEADLEWSTVQRVRDRLAETVMRTTADKLLALRPVQDDAALIDATGTVRRIQGLIAMGHSQQTLSEEIGCAFTYISTLAYGRRPTVTFALARSVQRTYGKLSMLVGPSVRARMKAARLGWPTPLAWDDDTIDDPAGRPDTAVEADPFAAEEGAQHVDLVAVDAYLKGRPVPLSEAERLAALLAAPSRGLSMLGVDRLHGLQDKASENFLRRMTMRYERAGLRLPAAGMEILVLPPLKRSAATTKHEMGEAA
jgi:hypothetical protein